jgi:hypothetical protein
MASIQRYPGKRSEYGGGDGQPQRMPDGSSLPLSDLASGSRVSERARLMRSAGISDFDAGRNDLVGLAATGLQPSEMNAAELAQYEKDLALSERRQDERTKLAEKSNDYINEPDQYVGEDSSGASGGVEAFGGGA